MEVTLHKTKNCRAVRPRGEYLRLLRRAAEITGHGPETGVMEFVFLDSRKMAELNGLHLHHQGVTDVITYDLREEEALPGLPPEEKVLASIYICPEVAVAQAEKYGSSFSHEIALYAVHGLLHLSGEDDLTDEARASMRRAEQRVLQELAKDIDLEQFHQ